MDNDEKETKTPETMTRRDALKRMKLAALAAAAAALQGVAFPGRTDAQYSEYSVGYTNHTDYSKTPPHDEYSKTDRVLSAVRSIADKSLLSEVAASGARTLCRRCRNALSLAPAPGLCQWGWRYGFSKRDLASGAERRAGF